MKEDRSYHAPTGVVVALVILMLAMASGAVAVSRGWDPGSGLSWASLVGTVIGGTIAIIGQLVAIGENRRQKLAERSERDIGNALSLLFKLSRIYSDFSNIGRYFAHHLDDEPTRRHLAGEPWSFFIPLISVPDPVHFMAEEMALLLRMGDDALFAKCVALDQIHNSFLASVKRLSDERSALTKQLVPTRVTENLSQSFFEISPQQRLDMNALNSLIARLRTWCAMDEIRSGTAVEEASELFRRRLGTQVQLQRVEPSNVVI